MRGLLPGLAIPLLAIPLLVGIPLWLETSWPVGVVAAASGVLCLAAVLRASLGLATVGGVLALIALALALALRAASSAIGVLAPALLGLSLVLLVDGTHLRRRYAGALVSPTLWRRHLAWWLARAAIALALALAIAALVPVALLLLPASWALLAAAIGIVAAFAAAVAFAWPAERD